MSIMLRVKNYMNIWYNVLVPREKERKKRKKREPKIHKINVCLRMCLCVCVYDPFVNNTYTRTDGGPKTPKR